jgi:hypothetical protein
MGMEVMGVFGQSSGIKGMGNGLKVSEKQMVFALLEPALGSVWVIRKQG